MFEKLKTNNFQVSTFHHAEAILKHDLPQAVEELEAVLSEINIPVEELVRSGGGEGAITQRLRKKLSENFGWKKHKFEIKKIIDGVEKESVSHEIDHVKRFSKGTFALEIEWNNKDPFFDRDLANFRRLHADGAISIGAIITRGASLQDELQALFAEFARRRRINNLDALVDYYQPTSRQRKLIIQSANSMGSFEEGWAHVFVKDKFGTATTHWAKLEERLKRGLGNPCPLLIIGIPINVVTL